MLYTPYGLYLTRSLSQAKNILKFNIQKTDKLKFFDVFSINRIENYPAAGETFLENVILKVSQTLFQGFLPQGGHKFFKGAMPPRGGCEVPCELSRLPCRDLAVVNRRRLAISAIILKRVFFYLQLLIT